MAYYGNYPPYGAPMGGPQYPPMGGPPNPQYPPYGGGMGMPPHNPMGGGMNAMPGMGGGYPQVVPNTHQPAYRSTFDNPAPQPSYPTVPPVYPSNNAYPQPNTAPYQPAGYPNPQPPSNTGMPAHVMTNPSAQPAYNPSPYPNPNQPTNQPPYNPNPQAYPPNTGYPPNPNSTNPTGYPQNPTNPTGYPPNPTTGYPPNPTNPTGYPPNPTNPTGYPPNPTNPTGYPPNPTNPTGYPPNPTTGYPPNSNLPNYLAPNLNPNYLPPTQPSPTSGLVQPAQGGAIIQPAQGGATPLATGVIQAAQGGSQWAGAETQAIVPNQPGAEPTASSGGGTSIEPSSVKLEPERPKSSSWLNSNNNRSSSRIALGSKTVSNANLTVGAKVDSEDKPDEYKYFSGEFDLEYDIFSFTSCEDDIEPFLKSDGVSVQVSSPHSPKYSTSLRISENLAVAYYGSHGFATLSIHYGPSAYAFQFANVEAMHQCANAFVACAEKLKHINSFKRLAVDVWKQKTRERVDEQEAIRLIREYIDPYFDASLSLFTSYFKSICKSGAVDDEKQFELLLTAMMRFDEDLQTPWDEVAGGAESIPFERFYAFLVDNQKEQGLDQSELKKIVGPSLTFQTFVDYMSSPFTNNGLKEELIPTHNMNLPLTSYYVNSSHNTYCTGDQYKHKSSVEMYTKLLRDGCRCIELDCWNGANSSPDIFHGNTLTSKIKFVDVVKAIRENAFVTSKYPVILSIENHCDLTQQEVMARTFTEILGEHLAIPPTLENQNVVIDTANALAYKILIKGAAVTSEVIYDPSSNTYVVQQGGTKNVCDSFARIIYLKSTQIDIANPPLNKYSMCSVDEVKIAKVVCDSPSEYLRFTENYFVRSYPKGTRVDSSNYSPLPAWCLGAQMVALNLQTSSKDSWINQALFSQNGCTGLIAKPSALLDKSYNPNAVSTVIPGSTISFLKIQVISARNLPAPLDNDYILLDTTKVGKKRKKTSKAKLKTTHMAIRVYGLEATEGGKPVEFTEGSGNLWRCKYNLGIDYQPIFPDLSFLLIKITKSKKSNSVIGYACAPIRQLKEGYRVLQMYDSDMNFSPFSTLLVYIRIERK